MPDFPFSPVKTVVVTGPTATGKTALAVALARRFDGEIVSVDSRQVYRGMDVGSGKDLDEYGEIPYHLINVADPRTETYNLGRFCPEAFAAIDGIRRRGKLPILCGGTVLYLAALLEGYRLPGGQLPPRESGMPRLRQDPSGAPSFQPPFALDTLILGVFFPRETVRERIRLRLEARFQQGMIEEVKRLQTGGVSYDTLKSFGLEYREIARFLQGELTGEEMKRELLNRIRQFAKRQDIFFRKLERDGHPIYWLNEGREPAPETLVADFLAGRPLPPIRFRLCDHRNPYRIYPS